MGIELFVLALIILFGGFALVRLSTIAIKLYRTYKEEKEDGKNI